MNAVLGPTYLYMPDLPAWLHWGIYLGVLAAGFAALTLLAAKLRRLSITPAQVGRGLLDAWRRDPGAVSGAVVGQVLAQRRVRRNRRAAWLHGVILSSFTMLLLGTTLIGIQHDLTSRLVGWEFLRGDFYLVEKFLLDVAALGLLAGVALAWWRRFRLRPSSLGPRPSIPLVYGALVFMSLSGLALEATRELLIPVSWPWWSFVGHLVALAISPVVGTHLLLAYDIAWGVHVVAAFTFIGAGAATMLDHVVMVPTNIVLAATRPSGLVVKPFDLAGALEAQEDLENLTAGFSNPQELAWNRRLMLDACLNCGRCEAVCPATASGRPLSPRTLVQSLRDDLRAGAPGEGDLFFRGVLSEDTIWSCLTCSACRVECPAGIDQPGVILDMRRHLTEQGRLDEQQAAVLAGLERNQNPLGLPSYQRAEWMSEAHVPTIHERPDAEYLYWIGCMASYDQRARSIATSMMQIMDHVGITYAVLGNEEKCHGECQRRLGDEAGFQVRTMEMAEQLRSIPTTKILTHCPHCMNTFVNDYREFGIELQVVHHSQLLAELIESGRLEVPVSAVAGAVAYHDPCNLGRILGEFDAPRTVVKSAVGPQFVEFGRNADKSFCCGAGGANYFYKAPAQESVSGLRLGQAREVGASTVATACPFCMAMLEDATRSGGLEDEIKVRDLSELVAEQLAL
jgi:Fe-S oxidoreductase